MISKNYVNSRNVTQYTLQTSYFLGLKIKKCNFSTVNTVVEICLLTKASVWSETSLNTGGVGVGGAWADPPTCKMGTFFLM